MKTCKHCGTTLKEDAKFCQNCGEALDAVAPKGAEEASASAQQTESTIPPLPTGSAAAQKLFPTKLLAGLAVAAVLLVFVGAAFSYSGGSRGSSTDFFLAYDATMAQIKAEFDQAAEQTGLGALGKALDSKGYALEFTMEEPGDETADPMRYHMLLQQTAEGDQFYTTVDLALFGLEHTLFECSYEDSFFALRIPLLFSAAYGVQLDQLGSRFAQSDLGILLDIDQQSADEVADYVDSLLTYSAMGFSLSDSTRNNLNKAFRTFEQTMQFTENGPVTVPVNGVSLLCDEYEASIEAEALEAYLTACVDALLDDPLVAEYLSMLAYLDGEAIIARWKAESASAIHDLCEEITELTLLGYVKDGLMLRLQVEVEMADYSDFIQFALEFGGTDHITDAISVSLYDSEFIVQMAHRGSIVSADGVMESRIVMREQSVHWDAPEEILNFSFYWDSKAAADNVTCQMVDSASEEQLTLEGTMLVDDGLFFSPVTLSFSDRYEIVSIPVSMQLTPLGQCKSLSSQAVDIFSMDADDIYALLWEVQESINNFPWPI